VTTCAWCGTPLGLDDYHSAGMCRDILRDQIRVLRDQAQALQTDHRLALDNLTSVQTRGTALLEENRVQRLELQALRVDLDETTAMKEAFGQKAFQMQAELTKLLEKLTDLQEELRVLHQGPGLPGWTCSACGAFTGTMKEAHTVCRCCSAPRPA